MRWLLGIVIAATALWCGWWWVSAAAMERATATWFDARRAEQWVARENGIAVRGFPNRLDLTVTAPAFYDPIVGVGWEATFAQLLTLSYKPWHLIAAISPHQRLTLPEDALNITSEKLQASLVFTPSPALPLNRIVVIGDGLVIRSEASGTSLEIATLRFATRQAADRIHGHDLAFEVLGLAPDAAAMAAMPAEGADLPDRIARIRLAADLDFNAPLDRHAARTQPEVTRIDVSEVMLVWGDLVIHGKGRLAPDERGRAEGRIDFRIDNWPLALAAATAIGWVTPEVAPTWTRALELLAAGSGGGDRLDLPLIYRNGRASLGPLPVGPAPVMSAPAGAVTPAGG